MTSYDNMIFFDKYKVTEKLGENSVFLSYLGTDLQSGASVLVKILNPARYTKYEVDRICFSNEVPTIISFNHPNILPLLETGSQGKSFCAVYKYEDYTTLDDYLSLRSTLDIDTALRFVEQIASALRYAQDRNILHRNIKPNNIAIVENGGELTAKLFDFGMSYIIDYMSTSPSGVDRDFGCMAPESTGLLDRKVDSRSDLYSLGVILYRMLTGKLPFHAETIDSMVYQHVAVAPKDPDILAPSIPGEISKMILKLLSKDPDLRYQSPGELINDIDRYSCRSVVSMRMPDSDLLQSIDQKTHLLGRKAELSQLRSLSQSALSDRGQICVVKGGLGFGKSDLLSNFVNELINNSVPYFRAHFSQQESMTPYHGFHDILDSYITLFDRYDRKLKITERNRLARVVHGLSDIVTAICSDMSRVLPASLALPALEGYKEQQRTNSLLAAFFLSIYTQEKPFVLILDDIHYADAASLALLTEIAGIIADYKVFVVCSYRADKESDDNLHLTAFLNSLTDNSSYTGMSLVPYTEQRMCDFLSDILMISREECQQLSSYLIDRTDGNPYFTANILRSMLEDGIISVNNGRLDQDWDRVRQLNSDSVMNDIIMGRVGRLSPEAVHVLEIASVIGYEFSIKLLLKVTDLTSAELNELLDQAQSLQIIEFSLQRDVMKFAHSDVHKVIIDRLSPDTIRDMHARIAKGIEALAPDLHNYLYSLVYHFSEAGDEDGLYRYIVQAADHSRASNANDDALSYYTRALPLIESRDGSSCELWLRVKRAIIELSLITGRFDDAINNARELLPLLNDPLAHARLLQYIGLGYFRQSRFGECEKALIEALLCLGEHFPRTDRAVDIKYSIHRLNRYIASKANKEPAPKREVRDADKVNTIVSIYETLSWIYVYSDLRKYEYTALYLFSYTWKHLGSSVQLATAASSMSVYYMLHKRYRKSEAMQALALNIRKDLADQYGIARSLFFTASCLQWRGEIDKSIKTFEEAAELFKKVGDRWELNNTYNYIAQSMLICGEYTESIKLCEDVIKHSTRLGDALALCQAYSTLICCYTERGDFDQATQIVNTCEPIVESLGMPYATVSFYNAHGRLLLEQCKFREATDRLGAACDILDKNNFIMEYLGSTYGYYSIARVQLLNKTRTEITLESLHRLEGVLAKVCENACRHVNKSPNLMIPAHRAAALLGIISEKYKFTEHFYKEAADLAAHSQTRYENAKLYYEYGCYLLSQHKSNAARYYIFEAYMTFSGISSEHYLKLSENIITEKYQDDFANNSILANVTARRNRLNIDRKINTLLKLGERLTSTLEIEDLQRKILQDAVELVGAERGILFLYPETGDKHLYVASVFNLGKFDCNTYDWMLEEVERTKKPIVINDVQSDEYRRHYTVLVRYGIKSVMAMPMFVRGDLFGVIYLDSRLVRHIFSDDYIDTMEFIANQAGAPISNARLYHRAITDGLTGVYGRSYLDNLVIDRTSDADAHLSAIMIDVDKFKNCNDTYGHPFGDKVLVQIAGIMKRISGDHGVSCRYGGEEFVVLLDSNEPEYVMSIAEKIRLAVESTSVAFNNGRDVRMVSVTISLGVSIWNPSFERIDLIEHADKALYYAKSHGRNRAVMWSPTLESEDNDDAKK